ncbi:MAG: phosphate ABC transporter ATP-binding protein [Deltaproteobacteria bacterium]|nr:phosphate ABC transporter ATP-binding protein [Deltaproteobacteria bacterium]
MKKIEIKNLNVSFDGFHALRNVSFDIPRNEILSIIGPANSGKSTILFCINRMIERIPNVKVEGDILLDDRNIHTIKDVEELRRRIGIVYATPIPLPMTIKENILFGPKLKKRLTAAKAGELVENSLKAAVLWDEVKERLDSSALRLSGGQQQRLCIARTLAVKPEVIMFDEPCSGLDPISTAKVEEAMKELKKDHTIVLVTNNTKQAARVGDRTAFLLMGELIEIDSTDKIFTAPSKQKTEEYVTGKFG